MSASTYSPSEARKPQPQLNFNEALTNVYTHCSGFLHNISQTLSPIFNPNSIQTHIFKTVNSLQNRTTHAVDSGISCLNSRTSPVWARIADNAKTQVVSTRKPGAALSSEAIEERLAGVPVYALSNPNEEFVLVSGVSSGKSLGLLFCQKEDAEALLQQMKSMDPSMRKQGSKVVALALNKVFQLKVDGVAFRLIPESTQISNALKERKKAGVTDDGFAGVPVFQSRSLILRSQNKSYRPVFFRKEDLEKSLRRASEQQNQLNPILRQGDIQVGVFEEIIKDMKESSTSVWEDVVFIPPGMEVSTHST